VAAPALPVAQTTADYLTAVCQLLWPPPAGATIRRRRRGLAQPGATGAGASGAGASGAGASGAGASGAGASGAGASGAGASVSAAPVSAAPVSAAPVSAAGRELIVLPDARRPKLILPAGRQASAAAIRRYGEPGSLKTRLATRTLGLALGAGFGRYLGDRLSLEGPAGSSGIESYLADVLGQPVEISLHLGAARANRKPVLQLLTAAGDTVGFAKIGTNPLTSALVQAERNALTALAPLAGELECLRLPPVLASGRWNGLEVLVLSPLPVWLRRTPLRPGQLGAALAELSAVAGTSSGMLAGSSYWQHLVARIEAADDTPERAELLELTEVLADQAETGSLSVTFGCWHGDLTSWNIASTPVGLLVWDWERFTTGVPLGYDALHYWLQGAVRRPSEDPALTAQRCVALAPELLTPFGVAEPAARLTALAYLAELSARYLADRQEAAGARLGAPRRWLLPALRAGLEAGQRARLEVGQRAGLEADQRAGAHAELPTEPQAGLEAGPEEV
jgi:hypothetical protein